MKQIIFLGCLSVLTLQVRAQHKVYTDDKGMITMTSSGDVTLICKGNNGMVSEQVSFPNEKGVAPMATTFNDKGLPSSFTGYGERITIEYGEDGHSCTAKMANKQGEKAEYKVKLADDYSDYHAPGIFGMLDKGLSHVSSEYGDQLKMAAKIADAVGNVAGLKMTTGGMAKDAPWITKLGGFLRSNKSEIGEQMLIGVGITPVETFSDMAGYMKQGISSGAIVAKTLLSLVGGYNEWKKKWSDFVYQRLDDMDFIDQLTPEEYMENMLLTGEEWEAFKKEKRAQWAKERQKKLEEGRKQMEEDHGQELIKGDRERTRKGYTGNLIDP